MSVKIRKCDWLEIAEKYDVRVKAYWNKQRVVNVVVPELVVKGVLDDSAYDFCEEEKAGGMTKEAIEFEKWRMERAVFESDMQLTILFIFSYIIKI